MDELMFNEKNISFLKQHVEMLCASYYHWTGKFLLEGNVGKEYAMKELFNAPFAVVSHGIQPDPVFNYGNQQALKLFEMSWGEFTALPSRLSAETSNQEERAKLLEMVNYQGFMDDYSGVRIAKSGRRFMIKKATIWNLLTAEGLYCGQAALIRDWECL